MTDKSFVSKINPKPDPHDMSISTLAYECDLKAYKAIEKLAAVDHAQWHFWSQSIMRDFDELVTALHDIDNILLECANPKYENSSDHKRVIKLIAKHNERDARWKKQWCVYTQLPEEVKEHDRIWAKKEYEALAKGDKE